jgi:four helix bundle protein
LVPLVAAIDRHDPDLTRQLKRARTSIPLNIAEGSHARGARRNLHYGYAKGSANECIAVLEAAHAAGYIRELPSR